MEALATDIAGLAARLTRLEERYAEMGRHLSILRQRSDEIERTFDARIDAMYREQLGGDQITELLRAVYNLGVRVSNLENAG